VTEAPAIRPRRVKSLNVWPPAGRPTAKSIPDL
jgi:hypothetical protein